MKTILFLSFFLLTVTFLHSQEMELQFPVSHGGFKISQANYSSDGKLLLTCQMGQKAFLWDAYSNKLIREFKAVYAGAFVKKDKWLLFKFSNEVSIVNLPDFQPVFTQKLSEGKNLVDAFLCNNEKNLVVITRGSWGTKAEMNVYEIEKGEILYSVKLETENPKASVNVSGSHIAVYDYEKEATIYDAATGKPSYKLNSGSTGITKFIFSVNDKWLAAISGDMINLFEASNGKLIKTLNGHKAAITDIDFNNGSDQLVSASLDKSIIIWSIGTGRQLKKFTEEKEVQKVSFTAKDNYLITGFEHFGMSVWDIKKEAKHNNLYFGSAQYLDKEQVSPDEKLIFSSMYGGAMIQKLSNGQKLFEFIQFVDDIYKVELSNNKKMLLSIHGLNGIQVWDLENFHLLVGFGMPDTMRYSTYFKDAVFSADDKTIIAGFHNGDIGRWDIISGKYLGVYIPRTMGEVQNLELTKAKDRLLVLARNGVALYQLEPLKEIFSFKKESLDIFSATFNPDESRVLINSYKTDAFLVDARTGEATNTIIKNDFAGTAVFSGDGKQLAIVTSNSHAIIYDPHTGKEIANFKTWPLNFNPEGAAILPDGKSLFISIGSAFFMADRKVEVREIQTGKLLKTFPGIFFKKIFYIDKDICLLGTGDTIEKRRISDFSLLQKIPGRDAIIDKQANRLIVKNAYAAEIYSLDKLEKKISYIGLGTADGPKFTSVGGISVTPTMYYMGDKDAVTNLHYLKGLQPIGFEQLDVLYNRPDKVLEYVGGDSMRIKNFRLAYHKRMKKLGIDPTDLNRNYVVPVADFENRDMIPSEQISDKLNLQIKAKDSLSLLTSYNVWINGVPVFGAAGVDITAKKIKTLNVAVPVTLSSGSNKIETSVRNVKGLESYKSPIHVFQGSVKTADMISGYQSYDPDRPIDSYLYFVGIGLDEFAESKYNLQWSVKDIRDLAIRLKEKHGDAIKIDTLFNKIATVENIKALKIRLGQSKVNDRIIIAYSGHGLLSRNFDYFLSTYGVNFEKPELNGLPYEALENLLDKVPARRKLLLIDACHSGEVDKDDLVKLNEGTPLLIKGLKPVAYKKEGQLGLKNSFELMQNLFNNVGKSTGATVIAAASGTEFALERNDLRNGVFTFAILEAMKNYGTITVSALKKVVGARVTELTNGMQQPTSRTENKSLDWSIW